MDALDVLNLKKSFGKNDVINGLTFKVPENTILGFLGKNGAGKTTTMKMVLGFLNIDEGEIKVFGEKVKYGSTPTNKYIGYLPDVPEFYGYMNTMEYLSLCGSITGLSKEETKERSRKILQLVGLENVNKRIKGFSRGMKQRLGIAQALLNNPKLLICDEPTSALDPVGRRELLDILLKLKGKTTVIFSTHILSDVEAICDQVVILNDGKNVLSGSIEELKQLNRSHEIEIKFRTNNEKESFMNSEVIKKFSIKEDKNFLIISENDKEQEIQKNLLEELSRLDLFPEEMRIKEPTLENIFMEVIQKWKFI